jgi:putative zinc finger/helix-turn-helix YgiT family protein
MLTPCVVCGIAELKPAVVRMTGDVRGESYTVEMTGLECPQCGYATIEGASMAEFQRLLADKYRAKHGLLTSKQIRARRQHLGMNQAEFAEHLEVGIASVKRWEMGRIQDEKSNKLIIERTQFSIDTVAPYGFVVADSTKHDLDYHPATTGTEFVLTNPGKSCFNVLEQYIVSVMNEWAAFRGMYRHGTGHPQPVLLNQHTEVPVLPNNHLKGITCPTRINK